MALKRDRIKGNELFLCVRETGTSFDFLPPPVAVKALKKLADVLFLDSAIRHRRRPLFVLGGQLHRLQFSSRVMRLSCGTDLPPRFPSSAIGRRFDQIIGGDPTGAGARALASRVTLRRRSRATGQVGRPSDVSTPVSRGKAHLRRLTT